MTLRESSRRVRAFSLVEVVIALGIVAFCIVAILSLFSLGLRQARDSSAEMRAASLASSLVARMRAAPRGDLTGEGFPFGPLTNAGGTLFQIEASAPRYVKGDGLVAASAEQVMASGGWALCGQGTFDASARVAAVSFTLWWPASVPLAKAAGTYSVSTYFDTEVP
jgi:hypothetical protein